MEEGQPLVVSTAIFAQIWLWLQGQERRKGSTRPKAAEDSSAFGVFPPPQFPRAVIKLMDHKFPPFSYVKWPPRCYPKSPDSTFDATYLSMLSRVVQPPSAVPVAPFVPSVQLESLPRHRTNWSNFSQVCSVLMRPVGHLLQFFVSEMEVVCTVSKAGLTFSGAVESERVEAALATYIARFVECGVCQSRDSVVRRDRDVRRDVVDCRNCGSSRVVDTPATGRRQSDKALRRALINSSFRQTTRTSD